MFRDLKRYGRDGSIVVRSKPPTFNLPLKRTRANEPALPAGFKVFTCSWSDWWHERADAWRNDAWENVRQRPDLIFQLVTKRPERIADHLPKDWGDGWPNVWLIVTAENQEWANRRVDYLMDVPAVVRGLSIEPLLGPMELMNWGPLAAVRSDQPPTWSDFRWPEWVPTEQRKQIADFWSASYGRSPDEWNRDNVIQHTPRTGEVVGVDRTEGIAWVCVPESPHAKATGRWLHSWNNMGRVILEDGRTICAASSSGPYWLGNWCDRRGDYTKKLHWIIVGGESGPNSRPMRVEWVRSLRDQCVANGVPFFFKQWGHFQPCGQGPLLSKAHVVRIDTEGRDVTELPGLWNDETDQFNYPLGKDKSGRSLDGHTWEEFPKVAL